MTDRQETIADIIAEIRALSNPISDGIIAINGRSIADRLEAAWKRERELTKPAENVNSGASSDTAGNCAKLREALVKCQGIALQWQADERLGVAGSIEKPEARSASDALIDIEFVANAALDAPPRNCDRYATPNDAMKAFEAFVRQQGKLGFINPYTEAFKWLFAPATETEGGAK